MRISDWSSDVCSSDLRRPPRSASQSCSRNVRAKLSGPPETAAATAGRGSKGASAAMAAANSGASTGTAARLAGRAQSLARGGALMAARSEEHTSELQSRRRISYAVFCLKKKADMQARHADLGTSLTV